MTRIHLKNEPKLRLADLLKRRKTTLKLFLDAHGISTLEGLKELCHRLGVQSPTPEEFHAVVPHVPVVSHPQEGVVVIEPLPVIDAETGRRIDIDAPVTAPELKVVTSSEEDAPWVPTDASQRQQFKKPKATKKQDDEGN